MNFTRYRGTAGFSGNIIHGRLKLLARPQSGTNLPIGQCNAPAQPSSPSNSSSRLVRMLTIELVCEFWASHTCDIARKGLVRTTNCPGVPPPSASFVPNSVDLSCLPCENTLDAGAWGRRSRENHRGASSELAGRAADRVRSRPLRTPGVPPVWPTRGCQLGSICVELPRLLGRRVTSCAALLGCGRWSAGSRLRLRARSRAERTPFSRFVEDGSVMCVAIVSPAAGN